MFLVIFLFMISTANASLQSGDILVQSADCSLCPLIEGEEGLPYSHTGMILLDAQGKPTVLESWDNVAQVSLSKFISRRKAGRTTLILRPQTSIATDQLKKVFDQKYNGHSYDVKFLWDNQNELGEKYYCSELVVKLLNEFIPVKFQTKPMHYQYQRDEWIRYFRDLPPDGLPGVSPADLARSPLLDHIGEIP